MHVFKTGYEVNIVRTAADGTQTPVPCYEQYNHHFSAFMYGKAVELNMAPTHPLMGHGIPLPAFNFITVSASAETPSPTNTLACTFAGIWLNPANNIEVLDQVY